MAVIASDRRTLVVGLGKTGLSCVRYLTGLGREVAVADSRAHPPGLADLQQRHPGVELRTGEFDREWFATFNELVVSPGIAIADPAIAAAAEQGAHIRGDIDLFAEAAQAPIIAITGSNGKTRRRSSDFRLQGAHRMVAEPQDRLHICHIKNTGGLLVSELAFHPLITARGFLF